MRLRLVAVLAVACAVLPGCGDGSERVLVGAGTTTVDSGFMEALESRFPGDVSIVGGSTAELLASADQGAFAVAIAHDETQELRFVAEHPDSERRVVFASRFLVVGPPAQVAQIQATSPAAVFAEVVANGWTFVTRDDQSGTHAREMTLWADSGVEPAGEWYVATGQGMGFTLQVADQRSAFTIVEEGAFLAAADTLTLRAVDLAGAAALENPYSAILVDEVGRPFYEWLSGPEGRAAIAAANQEAFGRAVYEPLGESE